MKRRPFFILFALIGLLAIGFQNGASGPRDSGPAYVQATNFSLNSLPRASVTVIVENMAGLPPLLGEWGLSLLVETDRHQILFDTGGGLALPHNSQELSLDLGKTGAIVISHAHDDHAGLVNTLEYVSGLLGEKKIYVIIGGTHLISASPQRMEKTIEALSKYNVQKIMLMHCTGQNAYGQLSNAFPGRCSWPASGTRIKFGT
jgi:metal-dependent hydrolase (beta-lactamase superfamily II)